MTFCVPHQFVFNGDDCPLCAGDSRPGAVSYPPVTPEEDDLFSNGKPSLESMSDSELRNLRSAVHKANTINCWWVTYGCGKTLSKAADYVLRSRLSDRRKAKALAKKASNV